MERVSTGERYVCVCVCVLFYFVVVLVVVVVVVVAVAMVGFDCLVDFKSLSVGCVCVLVDVIVVSTLALF